MTVEVGANKTEVAHRAHIDASKKKTHKQL